MVISVVSFATKAQRVRISLIGFSLTPLLDEQHFNAVKYGCILMQKIEQACHFSSLSRLCVGCKTNSRRAARRLIV